MSEVRFCANCGHELTDGAVFCPYCGTKVQDNSDPVSRGAVYERIDERIPDIEGKAIWEGNTPLSSSPSLKNLSRQEPSQMTCFKCGSLIPANSTYCPVCQVQLFVDCPKCGNRYSAQYPSCNKCGTNREAFLKRQKEQKEEEERQRRMQEEARRQSEMQKHKEEEQKRKLRARLELEKKAREQAWVGEYVRNNQSDITKLSKDIQERNKVVFDHNKNVSNGRFRHLSRLYLIIAFVIPMLGVIIVGSLHSNGYVFDMSLFICLFLGVEIVCSIPAIVYGNKKQREYYSLYKELYYVMNDTYRGQTGGILAYIDENDIRNALIQNGWKQ